MRAFQAAHPNPKLNKLIVFEDCPRRLRTSAGIPDLARLVPAYTNALTVLTAAEEQRALFGGGLAVQLRNAEDQVAATGRARTVVQRLLEQVPHGPGGRLRMLDIVWELRDDPRTLASVIALTAAALRAVAAPEGTAAETAGQ